MTQASTLLDAALAYAARGWSVIALHTPQPGGACSCGKADCDSVGKHPRWDAQLLPNGLKNATTDPGIIRVWWTLWPDANIGIATGAISGIWALDNDPAHGGDLSLEGLLAQHGPLPETVEARTGGDGSHLLFAHPGMSVKNRVRFAPGLDTRGDGGYIVAAPSLHASGRTYVWSVSPDDVVLAPAPAWLLALVSPAPKGAPAGATAPPPTNGNGHAQLPPRTLHYLLHGAPVGSRNPELYAAAQQFFAAGYTQHEAEQQLRPRAQADGLPDSEIDKTIASAYKSQQVSGAASAPAGAAGAAGASASAAPAGTSAKARQHSAFIASVLLSMGYAFRLNLCNDSIEVNGERITDVLAARIRMDARDAGLKPLSAVKDIYTVEAADHAYHPIQDYLNGLIWDGKPHIARLSSALRSPDPDVTYTSGMSAPLIHVYLYRWLLGAVAKVFDQRQNMMLVLSGPQWIGKSSLARWLCSALMTYFLEGPINVTDKDTDVRLISYFIWEVSELDATTRKADVSALKDFITRAYVTVRRAYGEHDTRKPALASLIGTVNESTGFLVDDTGNRRFLTVRIEAIDWPIINALDVNQVWAEAVAAYRRGESWELIAEERAVQAAQNRTHEVESVLEGWITRYFHIGPTAGAARMSAADIIDHLRDRYGIRLSGTEKQQAMEVARVLGHLSVQRIRTNQWRGYEGILPK